ncbi:MAG: TetR/AcrR family transcriptional regulator [Rhodobacteraceae bacterium]|nr:TetR/AcrR family transcriptional regulator [Paracoccaceae bacterium]
MAGAREVFLADGFEAANVDDIARAANVSKATIYSYFPDKRSLFIEVLQLECSQQGARALQSIDMTAPLRELLHQAGEQMVNFIDTDFGQRVFRICMAEAERFPEIGRSFYQTGLVVVRAPLIAMFESAIARGELKIDDLELAAEQFQVLCKANLLERVIFNAEKAIAPAEKQRVITGAVEMFLACYGT